MARFFLTILYALVLQSVVGQKIISIESSKFALVMQTDDLNRLHHIYLGEKLSHPDEYSKISKSLLYNGNNEDVFNNAYTPSGTWNIAEPALQITHSDGNPSTELEYVSHNIIRMSDNVYLTTILLTDPVYKTEVNLFFKVYQNENTFEQWTSIENKEPQKIELKKFASANLYLRNNDFFLTQFHGSWAEEMQPETHSLTHGMKVLDSKLGTRAHLYAPPTFMLSMDGVSTEETGKVLLANLAWSGNYKFEFEKDRYDNLRLIAGANSYGSEYQLNPQEQFETPHFIYTYSENGRGEASRNMHSWARKYRIYDGEGERLTLLNNWEATYFNFNEEKLVGLFGGAKDLGVDLFLLDDGWFANKYPRNSDRSGLGDWTENKAKLPNGLGYLVSEASKIGIKFGIWIEPEMVNPKSELYENHQDWVIRQPDRKEYYYRNQLVLDLSNPEVQDYVYGIFDTIFTKNPEIAYVKWDCNAVVYNAYSDYLHNKGLPQSHLYIDYVKGLYAILEKVRKNYPKVPIMLCSGGGGRVDYGALQYFTEFWVSDNTAPIDRVFMQWNDSYFYPSIAMSAHVTNWDQKSSIKFRTDVASMGKLGFDIVVDELGEKDKLFCQEAVKNYDSFSNIIWHGDLFRLQSPYEKPFACFQYVDKEKDRSIVFSYLVSDRFQTMYSAEPVKLQGLDPIQNYTVKETNLYPGTRTRIDEKVIYSGEYLMKIGFNPEVSARRNSVVLEITAVTN